ncbi:MAG: hypothetical protein KGD72_07930 [Candidatus Lokiarchaeota archaeon]|nr:hypothetical protein [Candidatus Lokiarchaeota archaeon]
MECIVFEKRYKIDKERLISYYSRIKRQFKDQDQLSMIAKFLVNQSIGSSYDDIYGILLYFKDKIVNGKSLLDFAIEWIRAQKIRLEYKKYLIRAQYPQNNLALAIDDCIFRFFLDIDKYLRTLLKKKIQEYNFSALYEIFFSPYDTKNLNIEDILLRHMHNVPTHFQGSMKINVNVIILRSALSNLIVKDYEDVLFSRKEEEAMKSKQLNENVKSKKKIIYEFNGSLLERMIKTYCIGKKQIFPSEIEKAVSQFLSSYLRFGSFYKFAEFKDNMTKCFAEDIICGLTDNKKSLIQKNHLEPAISKALLEFNKINCDLELDGLALKNDLTPILKDIVIRLIDTNLNF